jgi:NitT/TauT family transport system permease protein
MIGVWFLATRGSWSNPLVLPKPELVFGSLLSQLSAQSLWQDTLMTTFRALSGLALSALLGIPIGLVLGQLAGLYRHVAFILDFVRSIPSATLFPLFILAFGIGELAKVAVVFYGCFFIIVMAAVYGGRNNPDRNKRIATLRSLRARRAQIFILVVFPDAMTNILGGLRIAASIALVLVVVTEMFLGANDGLGKRIYDFYLGYRIPELYAALLILGVVGYLANRCIEQLEGVYKLRLAGGSR